MEKYVKIIDELPLIEKFIIYDGKVPANLHPSLQGKVFDWTSWLAIGAKYLIYNVDFRLRKRRMTSKPGSRSKVQGNVAHSFIQAEQLDPLKLSC